LSTAQVEEAEQAVQSPGEVEAEEQAKPAGPPVPYRANRTGLKTDHLLPPPIHRAIDGESQPAQEVGVVQAAPQPKPSLPPRLPQRSNSSNSTLLVTSTLPPPTYDSVVDAPQPSGNSYLNQGAVDRLGKAGISVSGLGIGQKNKTPSTEPRQSTTSPTKQVSELQARFSRLNKTPTSPKPLSPPPAPSTPTEGTTVAQKQAALQTAQSFHKDPSSVTLSDAQSAAKTANNFRERHQDQIAAGAQKANTWNKKLNITGRMNSFLEQHSQPQQPQEGGQQVAAAIGPQTTSPASTPDLSNRKPPPPPPPKKPSGMHGQATATVPAAASAPPPVPLGTKPSFG
jgi:hypothetical protein